MYIELTKYQPNLSSVNLSEKQSLVDDFEITVIQVGEGRIVIEPLKQVAYSLDALVAGITPKNSHSELSFGEPVGKELL